MNYVSNISTTTYSIGNEFLIDITQDYMSKYYEAWIWNARYGVKNHMFSVPMEQQSYNQFLFIAEANSEEYINDYIENHFDEIDKEEYYAKNNILES